MSRSLAAVLVSLFLTAAASAQTTLQFHIKLTDGQTALLANPRHAELKLSEEQIAGAAKDRVLLLNETSGMLWTWLMLGWPEGRTNLEYGLNKAGTARLDKDADVALKPIDVGTLNVRCLREQCVLKSKTSGKETTVTLAKGESSNVPFDSDIHLTLNAGS